MEQTAKNEKYIVKLNAAEKRDLRRLTATGKSDEAIRAALQTSLANTAPDAVVIEQQIAGLT
jgi:hypothetical protein